MSLSPKFYPKYSKQWPYLLTATVLNHGLFLPLSYSKSNFQKSIPRFRMLLCKCFFYWFESQDFNPPMWTSSFSSAHLISSVFSTLYVWLWVSTLIVKSSKFLPEAHFLSELWLKSKKIDDLWDINHCHTLVNVPRIY